MIRDLTGAEPKVWVERACSLVRVSESYRHSWGALNTTHVFLFEGKFESRLQTCLQAFLSIFTFAFLTDTSFTYTITTTQQHQEDAHSNGDQCPHGQAHYKQKVRSGYAHQANTYFLFLQWGPNQLYRFQIHWPLQPLFALFLLAFFTYTSFTDTITTTYEKKYGPCCDKY